MNKVEYLKRGMWHTVEFDTAKDAFQFWLSLRRGVYAKLYQDGVLTGEGR